VVALLFEERAEALAAFARARELGTPIRAADPWHTALLVRAVEGDATISEVEAELARATVGARFPATWLGYAHAVTLAGAGDRTAAEAAFGKAERAASRYPLFRAIALRLAAEAALEHPFGDPVTWLRDAEAVFVSRRLPRIASACRGLLARAGAPGTCFASGLRPGRQKSLSWSASICPTRTSPPGYTCRRGPRRSTSPA
jgi:hypothetical protein